VSGTERILADARSAGVRLHCLGIGSASQDRFLALLARETGGVSRFVTPRERVDLSALDLFASVGRLVASRLKAGANVQPQPPSFVFSGTAVLLFGEAAEIEEMQIELSWNGGQMSLPITCSENDIAETVLVLQGSRLITDWEGRYPSAEAWSPLEKRKENRVANRLLALSQTYGLASREMSLVAVVTRPGDRPGELPEARVVPVGMPQDIDFSAYFARKVGPGEMVYSLTKDIFRAGPRAAPSFSRSPLFNRSILDEVLEPPECKVRPAETAEDILLDLALRMESDGGMPGDNSESRAIDTIVAVLAFVSHGHAPGGGAFRSHVARLVSYLKSLTGLSSQQQEVVDAVIELARKGTAPAGEWITLARTSGNHWKEVERSVLSA
jgi:hypothetical protein